MPLRITQAAEALRHPRRSRIQALVAARPASTFRQLVRCSGIPAGTLRHHLSILSRTGLVRVERDGVRLRHFPAGLDARARLAATLERQGLAEVYGFVAVHGPVSQHVVLDGLGGPRSTTQHRLKRLVRFGVLSERPQGRRRLYAVAGAVPG